MPKNIYVVGYLSLNAGALYQQVVYAETEVAALNKYLETDFETMEQILKYCSNCYSYINVLEL